MSRELVAAHLKFRVKLLESLRNEKRVITPA